MTDITRSGSREYDDKQRTAVLHAFYMLAGAMGSVNVDQLADASGVHGRTVRQIMVDADGVDFLLAGGDEGYSIAEYREDAEAYSDRLRHTAVSLMERLSKREQYARKVPVRQHSLFAQETA